VTTALLSGRVALVTGAASGIGAAVASRFLSEGARVAALDLHPAPAATASAVADLRSAAAIAEALRELSARVGEPDILVHCAGICPPGSILDSDDHLFADTYDVNVISAVRLMRLCVPAMRARGGGSIVLLSSINARFATPTLGAYAASKAALEALAKTAALELAADGIRVNVIAPASIDSPMLRASFDRDPDPASARSRNVERHPLGRLGVPEDVAELALFLAADRSGWITGGVFPIDGGASVTRR
jgi:NAD(P)-dependent dehydrogenase (short-subunit alcohol dehydrogenase family)